MRKLRLLALCSWTCLALGLTACETPTIYEPNPAGKLISHASAQRPTFTPGDEFWFHLGGNEIVAEEYEGERDGLHAFRRALQNQTILYTPDLARTRIVRAFGDDEIFEPDDGDLEFPLAVSKTWSRKYRVRNESTMFSTMRTRNCEVLDLGQAQSEAGEFQVFRIACSLSQLGDANVVQEELLYAPEVGRIINRRTLGGGTTLNLIEFKRAVPN